MSGNIPKVLLDMSMSLDGFIGGVDDRDVGLYNWYFAPPDASNAGDRMIVAELLDSIGAIVMGRRTYESGVEQGGFEDNPYPVPHFVITHRAPETIPTGATTMIFVTDGVESAIRQAQAAVGDSDANVVAVGGGADIARQCLTAGLVDEIQIHLVPVLLREGIALFDTLDAPMELEPTRVIASPGVTHLRYRVVR